MFVALIVVGLIGLAIAKLMDRPETDAEREARHEEISRIFREMRRP